MRGEKKCRAFKRQSEREETVKGVMVEDEERDVGGRNEEENRENDRKWCSRSFLTARTTAENRSNPLV